MNEDILKGKWAQLKGRVKEQWGKLTDDEIDELDGRRDQLVGKVQERYGIAREQGEPHPERNGPHEDHAI